MKLLPLPKFPNVSVIVEASKDIEKSSADAHVAPTKSTMAVLPVTEFITAEGSTLQEPVIINKSKVTVLGFTDSLKVTVIELGDTALEKTIPAMVGPTLSIVYVTEVVPVPKFPAASLIPARFTVSIADFPFEQVVPPKLSVTVDPETELTETTGNDSHVPDKAKSAEVTDAAFRLSLNKIVPANGTVVLLPAAGVNINTVGPTVSKV